jgi:hypothetical protein
MERRLFECEENETAKGNKRTISTASLPKLARYIEYGSYAFLALDKLKRRETRAIKAN